MLDFRVETYLSVCETMNYRKSAELLHITQPAVTQHIQYLERRFGCKLFLYENRRLKQTPAGEILEKYARTMRAGQENMLRELQGLQVSTLRVGATKTIGECVIGRYAERFLRDPENQLTLIVDNTRHLLELLDGCRLDFALIEGSFDKTRYGYRLFSREDFVGICAPEHPFAGRQVPLQELLQQTLICREEGSGTRAILENKLQELSESISHFRRCICISSFPLIVDYVRKNLGISFVYQVLARQSGLGCFTIAGQQIQREFNLVYPKHTGAPEKIRHFLR